MKSAINFLSESGILSEVVVALLFILIGAIIPRLSRARKRRRMSRLFGKGYSNEVRVLLPVWSALEEPSKDYILHKKSRGIELRFEGKPDLIAQADVSASTSITNAFSELGFDAVPAYDNNPDLSVPAVIVGTSYINDAHKAVVESLDSKKHSEPLQCAFDKTNPSTMTFFVAKSGNTYRSSAGDSMEFCAIACLPNPFGEAADSRVVLIAGMYANGTVVAGEYFRQNWRKFCQRGIDGVILSTPKDKQAPIKVEEWF